MSGPGPGIGIQIEQNEVPDLEEVVMQWRRTLQQVITLRCNKVAEGTQVRPLLEEGQRVRISSHKGDWL